MDDYSRYPEVEILKSTIPKLDKIFSAFGIPRQVKTDNGPPFNSIDFQKFANHLGFSHRKTTPYWPQANGGSRKIYAYIGKGNTNSSD
jgi:transposase InsO family protein